MRIISGLNKRKLIVAPVDLPVRPTTDFAKTGLFNIINNRYKFDKINVLDLFAGTGSISFEFGSRQCNSVVAIDNNPGCIRFIKKSIVELKMENVVAIKTDVFDYLKSCNPGCADIIFADPPYEMVNYDELIELVFENKLLKEKGVFILEHQSKRHFVSNKYFVEERKYSNVSFTFFG